MRSRPSRPITNGTGRALRLAFSMNTNQQEPIPFRRDTSPLLEVFKIFPTIQGEGPFAGRAATFVRLYGCNLQCTFCDTDYTSQKHAMLPQEILDQVRAHNFGKAQPYHSDYLVVITGGEPFRQNLTPLCELLLAHGYKVQIETNGTLEPSPGFPPMATIVCSPKTGRINYAMMLRADAFKYVLEAGHVDPEDGLPLSTLGQATQHHVAKPRSGALVYVQPFDEQDPRLNADNLAAASMSAMKYGYILSVQTHKIANLE
jgi:7-carboxy-7-deazaguanine synthase